MKVLDRASSGRVRSGQYLLNSPRVPGRELRELLDAGVVATKNANSVSAATRQDWLSKYTLRRLRRRRSACYSLRRGGRSAHCGRSSFISCASDPVVCAGGA